MTRTTEIILKASAAVMAILLIVLGVNPTILRDEQPARDASSLAEWIAQHPADASAAAALSEEALETPSPIADRLRLWHLAHELSLHVAPYLELGDASFVRAGLFHWYELAPRERGEVIAAAAPLLRDERHFAAMHASIWQLTHDLGYLRRNAPSTLNAVVSLRDLAARVGAFADYRELREAVRAKRLAVLEETHESMSQNDILELLPHPIDAGDIPLVRAILVELQSRPLAAGPVSSRVEELVDFALRHDVEPLDGVEGLVEVVGSMPAPTRARLALKLGDPAAASRIEVADSAPRAPEWVAYDLDRALFEAARHNRTAAEGYITAAATGGRTLRVLAAELRVDELLDKTADASQIRAELARRAREKRVWSDTCGDNEVCRTAWTDDYITGERAAIGFGCAVVQSDQTPPYLEVYVDDLLVAEKPIADSDEFHVAQPAGLRHIEVRMVNPRMASGIQRRVRLS